MAFWPALLLARERSLPWALRGLLAGGAVLLAEVALLSQSRGSLFATPVMIVLVFALLPGRTRTFALLRSRSRRALPRRRRRCSTSAIAWTTAPSWEARCTTPRARCSSRRSSCASWWRSGAAVEARLGDGARRRVRIGARALAVATLVAVLAGGLAAAGNPVARVEKGWHSFKGGYAEDNTGGSRLTSGLGSNRYDFYRVALDEFLHHPLVGIGADNFEQQYLVHGRSDETPHYPHSVELRTLSQTGLVGVLLAIVGLGAALVAVARALHRPDPLARGVAARRAGRIRLLGGTRLRGLVLGVRRLGRPGFRDARPRLRARARPGPDVAAGTQRSERSQARRRPPLAIAARRCSWGSPPRSRWRRRG